jgi:hypothetical protein
MQRFGNASSIIGVGRASSELSSSHLCRACTWETRDKDVDAWGRRGAHVMLRTFTVPGYDMQMRACPLLVWDGAGREGGGMSTRVSSCESVPPTRHWSGSAAV